MPSGRLPPHGYDERPMPTRQAYLEQAKTGQCCHFNDVTKYDLRVFCKHPAKTGLDTNGMQYCVRHAGDYKGD